MTLSNSSCLSHNKVTLIPTTEVPVSMYLWVEKSNEARQHQLVVMKIHKVEKNVVFGKITLGVVVHHLDPTFINAHNVNLLQTWISLDKHFIYLNLLDLQFLESSKCIIDL